MKWIYVGTINGIISCIAETNGNILWSYKVNAPIFASPYLVEVNNMFLIIWANVQGLIFALNASSGQKVINYTNNPNREIID